MNLYDLVMNRAAEPVERDPWNDPAPGDAFKANNRTRVVTKVEGGQVFYDVPEMELSLQVRLHDWRGWTRRESAKLVKKGI